MVRLVLVKPSEIVTLMSYEAPIAEKAEVLQLIDRRDFYESEREKTFEEFAELLKRKIIESNLKSECFDKLSLIIHDTVVELRQEGEEEK